MSNPPPRFRFLDLFLFFLILLLALGCRGLYLSLLCDDGAAAPPLGVQGPSSKQDSASSTELSTLIHNLTEHQWFGGLAPLAEHEEQTAHVAPGYPWLFAVIAGWVDEPELVLRWLQCVLGALTAGFFYLFARRAFSSPLGGTLAGLLCALHPFWIVNTAELHDGVVATFLLATSLVLGTRAGQEGGAVSSLLFGLVLAGLAMVRAALLPFAVVGLLWFLLRCRTLRRGWFFALLAFLGFANGLAPWTVRNYQTFDELIPVADSAWWHLWVGNNPEATGGPVEEEALRKVLSQERLAELIAEANQARRYPMLAREVFEETTTKTKATVDRRLWAGLAFVFGEAWLRDRKLSLPQDSGAPAEQSETATQLARGIPPILTAALLGMLVLGFLGWRWSYRWRRSARLSTLALLWVPLPYVLSHAEALSGPRLPLDGILLCYAAFAIASIVPTVGGAPAGSERA
jgi:4-amino-4-deoxy-L-arabinose transferase-like glycosyltransferase